MLNKLKIHICLGLLIATPHLLRAESTMTAQQPDPKTMKNPSEPVNPEVVASKSPMVLGFMEWKSLRVHEAQQKLEQMSKGQNAQTQIWQEGKSTVEEGAKPNEQKLNFNVDVALQLNIQDYFSMYLKTLSPDEFKEATKKLNPDETAELLIAYKNSMDKDKKIPLKFSKIPKDNAKSKNTEI